jgi:hypothetical protein
MWRNARWLLRYMRAFEFEQEMKMKTNKARLSSLILLLAITACTTWTQEDAMHLFAVQQDMSIANKDNIDRVLNPRSAVVLLGVQEVQPGVMEYSFEDKKAKWFTPAEAKCRFIVMVNKDSGTEIGWRYNGNPEYCIANP